jgi:hypothetical protein
MITPVDSGGGARLCVAGITPEFYFHKTIDNSRVLKVADPRRRREIRVFSAGVAALFLLLMTYAWQHFRSIEYGYRIEVQKSERDRLAEVNRSLKSEEATLRAPGRIAPLARQMGLDSPEPGQVFRLDGDLNSAVIARVTTVAVVPAQ